jgi:hypothetical protein
MATIQRPLPGVGARLPLPRVQLGLNWPLMLAVAFAALSAMLPVLQNSTTTSRGFELQEIQARQATLEGEVSILESDIARLTSLTRIQRRAVEIGLAPAQDPIFVSVAEPGPEPAKIPAEYLPPLKQELPATESRLQSLLQWLPLPD